MRSTKGEVDQIVKMMLSDLKDDEVSSDLFHRLTECGLVFIYYVYIHILWWDFILDWLLLYDSLINKHISLQYAQYFNRISYYTI